MFAYVDMNPTILRSRQRRRLFVKDIDINLKTKCTHNSILLALLFRPFWLTGSQKLLNYLAFQFFDCDGT